MTGGTREWSVNVTTITVQMIFWIRNKSLHIFMKYLLIAFFKQDNAWHSVSYVWIKKIMPNLLFNKLGCRYLEHKKKHAPKGEGRGGGELWYISEENWGGVLEKITVHGEGSREISWILHNFPLFHPCVYCV